MIRLGLIGHPLAQSFSQRFFNEKFAAEGIADARYDLFDLPDIADFPALLAAQADLQGLNVTIPHKIAVMQYLDEIDPTAEAVGAVNTIRIRQGRLRGFNTDVLGFQVSLQQMEGGRWANPGPDASAYALILGTGGASRAVAYVLDQLGIPFRFVSRQANQKSQVSYEELRQLDFKKIRWIFNASPLGTYPEVETCPDLPYEQLHSAQLVYDLVYNPAETLLLQRAKAQGASAINGMDMLYLQAKAAWAIWQDD